MLPSGERARRSVIGAMALVVALLAVAPAAAAEAEPPFCEGQTLHDYLAPLKRLPKLREAPARRHKVLHFRGTEIFSAGPKLAISGGRAGYDFTFEGHPEWDVTVALARINSKGEVVERIAKRHHRLGETPLASADFGFGIPGRPALYRTTLVIRSRSGRKLGEFGNYYRVIRPSVEARLVLTAPAYSPGSTLFARVENPGAAFALFGQEYAIEKQEGEGWVRAPESPGAFVMPLYGIAPGATSNHCTVFPIPTSMPLGRYRLSQEILFTWALQHGHQVRPTLHAEFDVAVFATP